MERLSKQQIEGILNSAAALQFRPDSWGQLVPEVQVGGFTRTDPVYVRDLMRHQQRLADMLAQLAGVIHTMSLTMDEQARTIEDARSIASERGVNPYLDPEANAEEFKRIAC